METKMTMEIETEGVTVFVFFASLFCIKLQNKNVGCCKTVL